MIRRLLSRRRFMREHRWTHSHLSEYIDADLSPRDRERLEDHVSVCPQCRRVLATLIRTLEGLHGLRGEAPPGVADTVIGRLRGQG
jgi:anti-sigma factor RsiW